MVLGRDPEVLLLDEPTSALDPVAVERVELALAGRTGLLVTHDAAQGERLAARLQAGCSHSMRSLKSRKQGGPTGGSPPKGTGKTDTR